MITAENAKEKVKNFLRKTWKEFDKEVLKNKHLFEKGMFEQDVGLDIDTLIIKFAELKDIQEFGEIQKKGMPRYSSSCAKKIKKALGYCEF